MHSRSGIHLLIDAHGCARVAKGEEVKAIKTPFDSKQEKVYHDYLGFLQREGSVLGYWYHPLMLYLPGGLRYTPDWLVLEKDMKTLIVRWCFHELKGKWIKNRRDGITRLKLAASLPQNAWASWKLIELEDGRWRETLMP